MIILAFDLALNHFGWAVVDTTRQLDDDWGANRNPYGSHDSMGHRLAWLSAEFEYVVCHCMNHDPDDSFQVWKEGAVGMSSTVLKTAAVHGVFDLKMWQINITPHEVSPRSIKQLATGFGGTKTDKKAMIQAAADHLGFKPEAGWVQDQVSDAADALWVADFAARMNGADRPPLPESHLRALML